MFTCFLNFEIFHISSSISSDMIIDLHPRFSPGCHPGNVPCMPRCPSHSSPPVKHHQKSGGKISQQMVDHLQPPLESQVHVQWREERPFFSQRESWYTLAEENPLATAVGLFGFSHVISSWAVGPLASALIPSVPSWRKIREFQTSLRVKCSSEAVCISALLVLGSFLLGH